MKRLLTVMLLLLSSLPLAALAKNWQVDASQSTLGFKGDYQGDAFDGVFKRFEAKISYDATDLATAKFDVNVDLSSVDTQSSERDETLASSDFFETSKFPRAHFVTQSFAKAADGSVTAQGTLTLHGISKPVALEVKFTPSADGATLDVDTTLDRLDFGLGSSSDWADIGKAVTVHGHLVLH